MKKKNIFILTLIIFVLVIFIYLYIIKNNQKISYIESVVTRGTLSQTILATGTVQPENRLAIKPPIAGRIEQVLVKEGQKVSKGQILAWMSSTERAALLDAARSQGVEEVKRWEDLYRPTPVSAPIKGTIISRNVEAGQTFTNTDSILVISDRLTVKAQVDETDISQIKLKQRAEIVLDAYSNQKIVAKADQIAFEAKTVNNVTTYLVDVLPDQTPEFMRSGMTANVTFLLETKENVLLLSTQAIQKKDNLSYVMVRSANGKLKQIEIETGLSDGKQTEILSGLNENDVVLTSVIDQTTRQKQNTNPFAPQRGRKR